MTKELKQEFERILRDNGVPYLTDQIRTDMIAAMFAAYTLGQSSLKSRVEELEKEIGKYKKLYDRFTSIMNSQNQH